MEYFIVCHKTNDATHIGFFFFKDIVRLHGFPKSIVSEMELLEEVRDKFLF
jgi:hypothetical protein